MRVSSLLQRCAQTEMDPSGRDKGSERGKGVEERVGRSQVKITDGTGREREERKKRGAVRGGLHQLHQ